jgi:hypothetical protein
MYTYKVKYGFLTTYDYTIFLKKELRGDKWVLWHSRPIARNVHSNFQNPPANFADSVSVRECFLYLQTRVSQGDWQSDNKTGKWHLNKKVGAVNYHNYFADDHRDTLPGTISGPATPTPSAKRREPSGRLPLTPLNPASKTNHVPGRATPATSAKGGEPSGRPPLTPLNLGSKMKHVPGSADFQLVDGGRHAGLRRDENSTAGNRDSAASKTRHRDERDATARNNPYSRDVDKNLHHYEDQTRLHRRLNPDTHTKYPSIKQEPPERHRSSETPHESGPGGHRSHNGPRPVSKIRDRPLQNRPQLRPAN